MLDIISVYHNGAYRIMASRVRGELERYVSAPWTWLDADNTRKNIGFGPRVNQVASTSSGDIIALLNPDAQIKGDFSPHVLAAFDDPSVVIAGSDFGKDKADVNSWGLDAWVCGAAFFVRRSFWQEVGGFDPEYTWSWEETDLCRTAQESGRLVRVVDLPIVHASPIPMLESRQIQAYKNHWFEEGRKRYQQKWGRRRNPDVHPVTERVRRRA